jgi:acyl-CoA thioesterase I
VNERCLLFTGDSFVAGAGDPYGLGWAGRVIAAAWEAELATTAYNLGVRGESMPEVARRFRAEAEPRVIPDADNRLVVAGGANDVSLDPDGSMMASTEDTLAALRSVLDDAQSLGMRAMVIGPSPAGIADHDQRSRELGERFRQLAEKSDARYLAVLDDLLASEVWRSEALANDGFHPGAGGYTHYAELVLAGGFLDWLREP